MNRRGFFGRLFSVPLAVAGVGAVQADDGRFCKLLRQARGAPSGRWSSEEALLRQLRYEMFQRYVNPAYILNFQPLADSPPMDEAEIAKVKAEFEKTFSGPSSGQMFVAPKSAITETWAFCNGTWVHRGCSVCKSGCKK